jgi:hypothetical protein
MHNCVNHCVFTYVTHIQEAIKLHSAVERVNCRDAVPQTEEKDTVVQKTVAYVWVNPWAAKTNLSVVERELYAFIRHYVSKTRKVVIVFMEGKDEIESKDINHALSPEAQEGGETLQWKIKPFYTQKYTLQNTLFILVALAVVAWWFTDAFLIYSGSMLDARGRTLMITTV